MSSTTPQALAFSDLDSTLIYPARLATGKWSDPRHVITVERAGGVATTVMPRDAGPIWQALVAADGLVPVTTRTADQYAALAMPGPRPRVAIAGNGADILHDGLPDRSWRREVEHRLATTAAPFAELENTLAALAGRAALDRPYPADRLYFILGTRTPPFPEDLLIELTDLAAPLGWRAVAHGRRSYVLPAALDKHLAVERVAGQLGVDVVLAAGDSELDKQMLTSATAAIRPAHGELHERGWVARGCTVSASSGLLASEEILEWFAVRMREARDGWFPFL